MYWTCKFCDKTLELKSKYTKSGHLSKCKKFKEYKKNVLTEDLLIEEYINREKSAIEIASNHNLDSASSIIKLLKKFNIKTRSIKESKNSREKEKRKNTNLNKYGEEHNFSKNHPSRKKWEKDLFNKYEINNIFQRIDIIKKITDTKYKKGYIIPREYKTDKLERYLNEVGYYTNLNYFRFYNDINPDNYKRGHSTYHLDHKVSKVFGFLNNISPEIIGHKCNLEVIYYKKNLSKGVKCSITIDELLQRIKEFDKLKENEEFKN